MLNKLYKFLKNNAEIITFVICAAIYNVISTMINWFLLAINIHYLIATTIAYFIGVLLAYILNTKYVFKQKYSFKNLVKFIGVYISNYFITLLLAFILVDVLRISAYIAPILTIIFGAIYNYILSKFLVFGGNK